MDRRPCSTTTVTSRPPLTRLVPFDGVGMQVECISPGQDAHSYHAISSLGRARSGITMMMATGGYHAARCRSSTALAFWHDEASPRPIDGSGGFFVVRRARFSDLPFGLFDLHWRRAMIAFTRCWKTAERFVFYFIFVLGMGWEGTGRVWRLRREAVLFLSAELSRASAHCIAGCPANS